MTSLPTLFGAEPLGRGSGNVESLTGFFARLCMTRYVEAADVVRTLLNGQCPSGLFPPAARQVGNFLSRRASKLDLEGDSALAFAAAVERLTHLSDLHCHTFSALSGALAERQKRRRKRKQWCPACFAAWQADGTPLYEPLLWRFALVERCPVHRLALVDRCATCGQVQPAVTRAVPVGHCDRCGHCLHQGGSIPVPEEGSLDSSERWALWRSVALFRLLAWTSTLEVGDAVSSAVVLERFSWLLARALERRPVPWVQNRFRLAGGLGIHPPLFDQLLSGKRPPSLATLVDGCMQLGVDPLRLVRGGDCEGEASWPPKEGSGLRPCADTWQIALEVREERAVGRYPDDARALEEFIADDQAVDLARVGRRGSTRRSLLWTFPVRYVRAEALRDQRMAKRREVDVQGWNAVLDKEIASASPRSIVEIATSLGIRADILYHYCRVRVVRVVAIRDSLLSTHQPELRERVRAALVAALDEREGPTASGVARSLGIEKVAVRTLCPEECRLLIDQRARERRARYELYRAAMSQELERRRPRGPGWVAVCLGVCRATLRRAAPEVYAKLVSAGVKEAGAAMRRRREAAGERAEAVRARRLFLRRAADRELRRDSPRSAGAVASECGVQSQILRHYCPEQYQRLVELRRRRGSGVS